MYKQEGIENDDEDNLFDKEDSLLVIINEPVVGENIQTNIETMYHKGLDELSGGLNPVL